MAKKRRPPKAEPEAQIRLAMRIEEQWWVAYMAPLGTMDGAIELGRILYNAARASEGGEEQWKLLMIGILGACLQAAGGTPTGLQVVEPEL